MIPPAPRSARQRPLLFLALAVTTTVAVLSATTACTSNPQEPAAQATIRPAAHHGEPASPGPTATPSLAASPEPGPTDLASYLARLPAFGPAPRPEPIWLSRDDGQSAFAFDIPTDKRVAFLTIDDGIFRHPLALDLIKAAKVPVTLFLTTNYISSYRDYFKALQDTGYVTIQNHTVSHPHLPEVGYEGARDQLCPASSRLEQWFGTRPTLFRPPFGEEDGTTLAAAWDCGLKAGFHWRETVDSGTVYYQRDKGHIHAGDIVLMHFRPAFPDDFIAALTAIKDSGLSVARLEDYIRVRGVDSATPTATPPPEGLARFDAPSAVEPDRPAS